MDYSTSFSLGYLWYRNLFHLEGPNICISMGPSRYKIHWKVSAGMFVWDFGPFASRKELTDV